MAKRWMAVGLGLGLLAGVGLIFRQHLHRPLAPRRAPIDRPPAAVAAGPTAPPPSPRNQARVALGRTIFFDQCLSEPPGTSCAGCHDPAQAFAGNHGSSIGVARGSRPGHFARRNTPSVLYLKFVHRFHYHWEEDAPLPDAFGGFFWDGRADSLAALVEQPLTNPDEMNLRDRAQLAQRLRAGPYAGELRRQFGAGALDTPDAALAALGRAVEAFLTSDEMTPFRSRYDDYIRGRGALTPLELRGLALFRSPEKGNCASCHRFNPTSPNPARSLFTDYGYEAPAVPRNPRIPANRDPAYADRGLCERDEARSHTDDPRLCSSFRTPSLRNVAVRRSFMHNGAFSRLRDAVAFYATRSTDPARWYRSGVKFDDVPEPYRIYVNERLVPYDRGAGQTPRLDDGEIDAIVAFLETLTDAPYRPAADGTDRKSESSLRRSEGRPSSNP
jgi:cytochrome c peroxidase